MATDINVSQLIINKLTQAQYDEAKAAGNISESELYFVTDDNEVEIADIIAEHNGSGDAHADIRASIPSIAGLATEQYVNDVADTKTDKAFSNVVVGSTTIVADSKDDSLTIEAGDGISVSGDATNDKVTITNSGVRSIKTGSVNGTISVDTNGTSVDVSVKGLGSAAYTDSTAYDASGTAKTKADKALEEANKYTDNKIALLMNNSSEAVDSIMELATAMEENDDVVKALEDAIGNRADKDHHHVISDVSGLQDALDGKAASEHGTHVSYSTTAPVMDGAASVGSASTVARSDHKHPTDTSRAAKSEFDVHTANTTVHITSTERTNWNAAKNHADSAHAPSNAEKNQNAFSNIAVGSTTIAADTATDTLTLVAGSNVTITPDAANDKITIAATDTVYTLPVATSSELGGVKSGTDVTIDANGNVSINDDSHNHVIDNVDGLQDVLNEKMSSTDPTGTGSFSLNRKSNTTIGTYSFAEGGNTEASGYASHAEGYGTKASLDYSHAEGYSTIASGYQSHAEGMGTEAKGNSQHVQGKYNIADTTSLHIVGNGASGSAKSNAHTIDEDGNAWFAGDVYVGSTSGVNRDDGSKKLATEDYVGENSLSLDGGELLGDLTLNNSALKFVVPNTVASGSHITHTFDITPTGEPIYTDFTETSGITLPTAYVGGTSYFTMSSGLYMDNGEIFMNNHRIRGVANPTHESDAVNKRYVDAAIAAAIEAAFANIARAEEVAF